MKAFSIKLLTVTVCLTLLSACLVINSNGNLATVVPLHEHPETKVTILDKKGKVVLESQTPAFATMQANDEYLAKEKYSIVFQTPGYIERSFTIRSSSYGTYYDHVPNLRPLGVLVLNSKTGALFQIDKETILADKNGAIATERRNDFEIYTLKQLPSEWKSLLYPLN
ncbi:MAG: hypothetical protein R8G66_09955 [Cytophagales bacterium]|nr:hypothetical protein [Cytophagales bacterium]